jgi:aspartyl protease family protein
MLGSLYLLMAIMLVAGSLISRREKFAKMATMALAWVAIFGAGFILFTFRDDLGFVAQPQGRSDRRAGGPGPGSPHPDGY